ncbi:MAG: copper resistance protein B [Pseudomonadota bacterium]|nr:copper resistance protein B [Pseudomonadota bacterium]
MNNKIFLVLGCLLVSSVSFAGAEDDPLLFKLMIDKLEWRAADGPDPWVWDADAWIGTDLNKLWLKSEGEYADGATEAAYGEVFYSRAIAPFWDLQAGWRHDFEPARDRDWFAVGFKGLAPYWLEVDATLYAGGNGTVAGRLDAEYEFLFTQRLILSPELEANFYGNEDPARGIGSGISDLELGLRLRYEIRREFAPYIGINWEKKFGGTADFAREEGESTSDLQFVVGVRAWF